MSIFAELWSHDRSDRATAPRLGGPRPIAEAVALVLARYERQLEPEISQPLFGMAVPVLPQGMEPCGV